MAKRARKAVVRPVTRALKLIPQAERLTVRQQAAFVARSGDLLGTLRRRLLKIDASLTISFTLAELRVAVLPAIGKPCQYCRKTLTIGNLSLDHADPVSRGGSNTLANLEVICKSCNTAKGELRAGEFEQLLAVLAKFEPFVANDVLGRLKAGGAAKRLKLFKRKG